MEICEIGPTCTPLLLREFAKTSGKFKVAVPPHSLQTLFDAWRSGALTPGYMQKTLSDLARQMAQIEADDLVPPGWKASWDRYAVSRIFVYYSSYHAYPRCHCCKRES